MRVDAERVGAIERALELDDPPQPVAADNPDVKLDHQLVDSASMRLITAPRDYDVVVTENLFGIF